MTASNADGETLVAWTEGTAWAKGGSIACQVYDKDNKPTAVRGRVEGLPVWGLLTAVPKREGGFPLVY